MGVNESGHTALSVAVGGGESGCDCDHDSDKENIPPSKLSKLPDPPSAVGTRVIRLNEGPLPSKVLVPREFVETVHSQFVGIRDKLEEVIARNKKDKDAARKRHERARNKLLNQMDKLKGVVSEREAAVNNLETALRNQRASAEKLREQLAAARTELVNAKMAGAPVG
eukprot:jgi/Mesvir1/16628/Mv10162-RA.1